MVRVEQINRDRKARGADEPAAASTLQTGLGWALGLTILTLCVVGFISRWALLCALFDGLTAAVVLLPAVLGGLWLVPLFRLGPMPLRWHLLLGAALGIGCLSLLVLSLGLSGCLQRTVWLILLSAFSVLGVVRFRSLRVESKSSRWSGCVWLPAIPFLVLAILAASNAPGLIWQEEGNGYDVLEYHLQMPKEYLHAGRISYAPHNVYANFPANVEMLYLLAMILLDDDVDAGVAAHAIHLYLAALTVFATWVVGRDRSPRVGVISALTMATAGWLAYLSGLAYVENGVLFFGMCATGAMLRAARDGKKEPQRESPVRGPMPPGWLVVSGVLAGFAAGCKYTAVPMVVVPLVLGAILMTDRLRARVTGGFTLAAAALMALSPWLVKNQVMTGNPVFPLLNDVFKASPPGWDSESTARWERGHTPPPQERSIRAKLIHLWRHVLWDRYHRFGPAVFLLALGGLLWRRRGRADAVLIVIAMIQMGVWLFATHLYARFAVPLLIPLTLLAGRCVVGPPSAFRWRFVVGVLALGGAWNFAQAVRLHRAEAVYGVPSSFFYRGFMPGYEYLGFINDRLPARARVLLVGDARAFYVRCAVDYHVVFNLVPFARAARDEDDLLAWLRAGKYTHVLIHWAEIDRLRNTYGFGPEVNSALLDRLCAKGLRLMEAFPHPLGTKRYVELYELPSPTPREAPSTDKSLGPHRDKRAP